VSERKCKFCRYDLLTSEAEVCMDCLDAVDKLDQLAAKDARIAELEAALREAERCLEYAQCYECGRQYRDDPGDCLMATHIEGRGATLAARHALGEGET
jgi:hypothetical protein